MVTSLLYIELIVRDTAAVPPPCLVEMGVIIDPYTTSALDFQIWPEGAD